MLRGLQTVSQGGELFVNISTFPKGQNHSCGSRKILVIPGTYDSCQDFHINCLYGP